MRVHRQRHAAGGDAALETQGREAGQLPGARRLQPGKGRESDTRTLAAVHVRTENAARQTQSQPGPERVQHTHGVGRGQGGTLQGGAVVQHFGAHQRVPGRSAAEPRAGRLQRRERGQHQTQIARVHGQLPVQHAGRQFAQTGSRSLFARKG